MKQRLITTIFTLLCLTVFSTASYAWRTDWKAKANEMIVVSPEVNAEIAKSPDKAKLDKVVKTAQSYMRVEMGFFDTNEDLDMWWEDNLAQWMDVDKDKYLNQELFPDMALTGDEYYLLCDPIKLSSIKETDQGYEVHYQAVIATKVSSRRYILGNISESEIQAPPESGNTFTMTVYINSHNKVFDVKATNRIYSKRLRESLETAKLYLDMAYKTKPGIITIAGEDSRESQITLYSKQLNFLTQANKVCPKY